ncbi:MAG: O-antigen ligase family protein [Hyphomicrobium sp.]
MSNALTLDPAPAILIPKRPRTGRTKSAVHRLALAVVWLTVALSFLVFSEPAPSDALTMGLFVLLPVIGLFDGKRGLTAGFALWLVVAACLAISCFLARDAAEATLHSTVTFYLYGACLLFAGFIARNPLAHTRLVLNAYFTATVLAAALGVVGYLDLFPGAFDLLTRYGRATGTFKDPNVFGPFLIPGLLMALHLWLVRPIARGILPLAAAALITLAILFSFSRGAWAATAIALAIYGYVYLYSAERNIQRLKLGGLVLLGAGILGLLLAVALQSDGVAQLLEERAALTQPYDEGPEGRFGGQQKAFALILENPLGIGGQTFTHFYHHEEAHNVYLSMFMNAGWLGGMVYLIVCLGTLVLGFRHALRPTQTQLLFVIAYAALAGNIIEGYLIDTDHWRHFYLLMGVCWGLMASDTRVKRKARIVRDVRPVLMRAILIVPPSKRGVRITGRIPKRLPIPLGRLAHPRRRPGPRRQNRIVGGSI